METFLITDRLRLRRFTGDDLNNLYELDRDPEVMRLLTNGVPTPYEVVRDVHLPRILATYARSDRHGRWAIESRASGEFLGWGSLEVPDHDPSEQAELGYRLRRASWGRGYATEAARALIGKAFTELGLQRVYAETMAVNTASRRVLEKAGMSHVRTFHLTFDDPIPGTEHGEVEYAIDRAGWQALAGAARGSASRP